MAIITADSSVIKASSECATADGGFICVFAAAICDATWTAVETVYVYAMIAVAYAYTKVDVLRGYTMAETPDAYALSISEHKYDIVDTTYLYTLDDCSD